MKKTLAIVAAAFAGVFTVSADVAVAFEFNGATAEGWTHNTPASNGAPSAGGGVITGVPGATPTADIRVLYNPDFALDTGLYTSWDAIEVRFRRLDNGTPAVKTAADSSLFLGISDTASGANFAAISITGAGFVRESSDPLDTEFWYTATLDISGAGANDIGQIRFDPVASLQNGESYQIDYVRVNAIPEPGTIGLVAAFGGAVLFIRRRFML